MPLGIAQGLAHISIGTNGWYTGSPLSPSSGSSGVLGRTSTLSGSHVFSGANYLSLSPIDSTITPIRDLPFTHEGWFYCTGSYNVSRSFFGSDTSDGLHCYSTDAQTINLSSNAGTRSYTWPANTLQPNKWQYIIVQRDAETLRETMWIGTFVDVYNYVTCIRATGCSGGTSIIGGTQIDNTDYTGFNNWIGRSSQGYFQGYITNIKLSVNSINYRTNFEKISAPPYELSSGTNGVGANPYGSPTVGWGICNYLMLGGTHYAVGGGVNLIVADPFHDHSTLNYVTHGTVLQDSNIKPW